MTLWFSEWAGTAFGSAVWRQHGWVTKGWGSARRRGNRQTTQQLWYSPELCAALQRAQHTADQLIRGEKCFILDFLKMLHPFDLAKMLGWTGICYLPHTQLHLSGPSIWTGIRVLLSAHQTIWCFKVRRAKSAWNLPCRRFKNKKINYKTQITSQHEK